MKKLSIALLSSFLCLSFFLFCGEEDSPSNTSPGNQDEIWEEAFPENQSAGLPHTLVSITFSKKSNKKTDAFELIAKGTANDFNFYTHTGTYALSGDKITLTGTGGEMKDASGNTVSMPDNMKKRVMTLPKPDASKKEWDITRADSLSINFFNIPIKPDYISFYLGTSLSFTLKEDNL